MTTAGYSFTRAAALVLAAALCQSACRGSSPPPAGDNPASNPGTTASSPAAQPAPAPDQSSSTSSGGAPAATAPAASAPAAAPPPAQRRGDQSTPAPIGTAARAESAPPVQPSAPPPPPPPPPPRQVTLASGTQLQVHTTSTLSTSANETGERFVATLAEPITSGDWVIAKRGARVEGVIVDADKGGRTKGVASLTVALRALTLADGRVVNLQTNAVTEEAESSKGKDAKKIAVGAGIGTAIGAIAGGGKGAAIGAAVGGGGTTAATMATRGDAAAIAGETPLTFVLTAPLSITEQRN